MVPLIPIPRTKWQLTRMDRLYVSTARIKEEPQNYDPVDLAIDLLQTAKTVDVTEVKDEDFSMGIAQTLYNLNRLYPISVKQMI